MAAARYGVDAPGVMLGLLAAGAGIIAGAVVARSIASGGDAWGMAAFVAALVVGCVPAFLGCAMVAYTFAGKRRMRDRMVGALPWTGAETVLDVGAGAGLLLIGAAKRLTTGRAIGIDAWSAADLSNNSAATTKRNIALEGVQGRAEIRTADARALPFANATVDRVVSLLCLHNIPGRTGQAEACREIARVLRPGGIALIGDYVPTYGYAAAFRAAGLRVVSNRPCFGTALSLMWLLRAEKPLIPVGAATEEERGITDEPLPSTVD